MRFVNRLDIASKLGLQEGRCIVTICGDYAEMLQVAEQVAGMCDATFSLRIAE